MAKYTGVVKWFDDERGFGFISTNEGSDVFVHHSQINKESNSKDIHEGVSVTFDIVEDKKGPAAINVHKL